MRFGKDNHGCDHQTNGVNQEVTCAEDRLCEMRVRPYLTEEKKIDGAVLSFVDITERKLLENERIFHLKNLRRLKSKPRKLVQSERLAVIGQTAGMVGHDLRNPLQTISGEVFLAKNELIAFPESEQKTNLQEAWAL